MKIKTHLLGLTLVLTAVSSVADADVTLTYTPPTINDTSQNIQGVSYDQNQVFIFDPGTLPQFPVVNISLQPLHYVIDSATSTGDYNPGAWMFADYPLSVVALPNIEFNIHGSFDVTIWTDAKTFNDWLTISNLEISGDNLPSSFKSPSIVDGRLAPVFLDSPAQSFTGSSDACFNMAPGTCTGLISVIPFSTVNGTLANGNISLTAVIPVGYAQQPGGFYASDKVSTYKINATFSAVPTPGAFLLFGSALGLFGVWGRQKRG